MIGRPQVPRCPIDYHRDGKGDTVMEWYLKVVKDNYANATGRARRKEYWMFFLFNMIFAIVAFIIDLLLGTKTPLIFFAYLLAMITPSIAVAIRRLHDIGKNGWWYCISFIPIVGDIWLLVLLCKAGNPGDNLYGPSPKAAKT